MLGDRVASFLGGMFFTLIGLAVIGYVSWWFVFCALIGSVLAMAGLFMVLSGVSVLAVLSSVWDRIRGKRDV